MPDRYLLSPTAQLDIDNVREIQKMMFSFLSTVHFHCISSLHLFCLQVTVRRLSLSLVTTEFYWPLQVWPWSFLRVVVIQANWNVFFLPAYPMPPACSLQFGTTATSRVLLLFYIRVFSWQTVLFGKFLSHLTPEGALPRSVHKRLPATRILSQFLTVYIIWYGHKAARARRWWDSRKMPKKIIFSCAWFQASAVM